MVAFISPAQQKMFGAVLSELDRLGYRDDLLKKDYSFEDWFSARSAEESRLLTADAVAFGQLPVAPETACFGISLRRSEDEPPPVSRFRSLAAPLAFDIT